MSNKLTKWVDRNASTILSGIAVAGVGTTAYFAGRDTLDAQKKLNARKEELGRDLNRKETILTAAKSYIRTAVSVAVTGTCIIASNRLDYKKKLSLAGALGIVSKTYSDYRKQVVEDFGQETDRRIIDEIAAEKASSQVIYSNDLGGCNSLDFGDADEERLFYDSYGERYFKSTVSKVMQAEYHLNRNFALRGDATLNEFYDFLGIDPLEGGDEIGWEVQDELYWVDFDHHKATYDDGLECYIIDMVYIPHAFEIYE